MCTSGSGEGARDTHGVVGAVEVLDRLSVSEKVEDAEDARDMVGRVRGRGRRADGPYMVAGHRADRER